MSLKEVAASCCLQITMGMKPGKCFWNCLRVLKVEKYQNAIYVEGIAVKPEKSIYAHGWLEVDGEIVDPTQPTAGFLYYPALKFQGIEMLRRAMKKIPRDINYQHDLPIYKRFGRNGEKSDQFTLELGHAVRDFGDSTPFNSDEEL